jgi:serine/threonine protein kinase
MNPRLQVIAGPLGGEIFPLAEKEFSIGRASFNRLCLNDGKVSRTHCLITQEGAGFRIKDLGSQNGTYVALKFLPDRFANDTERLARFKREAKLLAALSHPNIAAIQSLEQSDNKNFLVLELVEGETLLQSPYLPNPGFMCAGLRWGASPTMSISAAPPISTCQRHRRRRRRRAASPPRRTERLQF